MTPWNRLKASRDQISGLSGWRRALVAFLAGAVSCLALPPFYVIPILLISFGALVWLLDGIASRSSEEQDTQAHYPLRHPLWRRTLRFFVVGWWFGFGQLLFGLYWISNALLVDAPSFAWAVPFSAALLPAGLAFLPAIGLASAAWFWSPGAGRVALLAIVWTGAEWVRGHAFTGFPWNLMGYVWTDIGPVIQSVAIVGIYGLSLVTVLAAAAPAALVDRQPRRRQAWIMVGLGALLIVVAWVWGHDRLAAAGRGIHPDVVVRIVQPNIEQRLKWRRDRHRTNFERHLDLTTAPGVGSVTLIVWPEAATPYLLNQDQPHRAEIAARLAPGQILLTGAVRTDRGVNGDLRYWNSLLGLDDQGRIQIAYDKAHLVPFGEYLPLRVFLSWLGVEKITAGLGDYSAGPGLKTLQVPGAPPFSPLICYEVIFPGSVARDKPRPAWLLNVTNDAWYGISTGPYQHFAIAKVRAIEEGLPLVRAANTGISAIIDPYGRKVAQMGLGEGGVLDAPLPLAIQSAPIYARFGDGLYLLNLLIFSVFVRIYRKND